MVRSALILGCLVSLLIAAGPRSGPGGAKGFGRKPQTDHLGPLMRRGANRQVIRQARRIVDRYPKAVSARAFLGIALAREGIYASALSHLEATRGTKTYERFNGVGAHADVLRAMGEGEAAWALRESRLDADMRFRIEVMTLVHGVDDLLEAGQHEAAIELGWRAVSVSPRGAASHAFLATAYAAAGDWSEAGFHRWVARRSATNRMARVSIMEAWLAERDDAVMASLQAWDRAMKSGGWSPRAQAWHAAWSRRQGRLDEALGLVSDERWSRAECPDLYAERVRVHRARGEHAAADLALAEFERVFPGHTGIDQLRDSTENNP